MRSPNTHGRATALPIARAFMEGGGRLLVDPQGRLEASSCLRWALPDTSDRESRLGMAIERRFCRGLRNASFRRSVKALVVTEGRPTPNGWLVLEKGA
jgi:hypothetical protein